ncbi:GerW family sporulation protein [Fibrobacter sp.]|uniref:GerW family sporulation protein n=1 Tax=Fibrobacter sp. TaxID=35828 RepID=UPI0025C73C21|nr:GerW family sporulation protein [Fibrobacter sp.]MBR3073658.1 GerW family sporulation protein [Fibrobacter sp.]
MAIEKLAETLLEKLRYITKAETVIGEPIQAGESTVIPVSRVSVGFGFGGHQNKGDTSASGGGASVEPVAFLVIRGDDVRIMPITKDSSLVSKIMDIVPDVMNKFSGKNSQDAG